MASESSANAGSKVLRGNEPSPSPAPRAESRKEDREDGRSGVVGREVRERELGRRSVESCIGVDIVMVLYGASIGSLVYHSYNQPPHDDCAWVVNICKVKVPRQVGQSGQGRSKSTSPSTVPCPAVCVAIVPPPCTCSLRHSRRKWDPDQRPHSPYTSSRVV